MTYYNRNWSDGKNGPVRREPYIRRHEYCRLRDFTFSLGYEIDTEKVIDLLIEYGITTAESLHNDIKMVKVGRNLQNRQVLVTCQREGENDLMVDKLFAEAPVINCHSYSNKEIPVKFSLL